MLLALLMSACNKPLPDSFDIIGLWCEGMDGLCLPNDNDHTTLYLFSQLALPENPNIKFFAAIDQCPLEQIARKQTDDHTDYYNKHQLAELANTQLESISNESAHKSLDSLNYATPAASSLVYNQYIFDKPAAEVDFFETKAEPFVIRSECETKLRDILGEQNQIFQNYFLRHNQFIGFDNWAKTKAKAALAACLSGVKTTAAANAAEDNPENRIAPIRYLSGIDIQLGEQRLTRIPLHSLQERLHANDAETQTVIARLALQEAMQRSKAYLNCDASQTTCDSDEFGMARAKPKPVAEAAPASHPPSETASKPSVRRKSTAHNRHSRHPPGNADQPGNSEPIVR